MPPVQGPYAESGVTYNLWNQCSIEEPNGLVLTMNQIIRHLDVPSRILKGPSTKIGQSQIGINKSLLNQFLGNCDNSLRGLRNKVPLRLGYETMRRRSELCAFKFEDICQAPNRKPAIRLNFSKTDQYETGKMLPISQELFDLLQR